MLHIVSSPKLAHSPVRLSSVLRNGFLTSWVGVYRLFPLSQPPGAERSPITVQGRASTSEMKLMSIFLFSSLTLQLLEEHLCPVPV